MPIDRYDLTIRAVDLLGDVSDVAGLQWSIAARSAIPGQPFTSGDNILLLTSASGNLDDAGDATVEVAASPTGSYYDLIIGTEFVAPFTMPAKAADAASLIRAYAPYTPTPQPDSGLTHTSAPVSGDGTVSHPVTIQDDAITGRYLADGVIPDIEGNPSSAADAGNLTKLKIGTDTYAIPEGGSGGLSTVHTSAPVSGDGSSADPVTIGDKAIAKAKLADGVIPDITGLATKTALATETTARTAGDKTNADAITAETTARKAADTALGTRIDGVPVVAANPDDSASGGDLTKLKVGSATYSVPTSGGGGGLSSVATSAPVSGDGTSGSPVTIADKAIAKAKLADGVIPDVTGLATKTALATETTDRKAGDAALDTKIGAIPAVEGNPSTAAGAGALTKLKVGTDIYTVAATGPPGPKGSLALTKVGDTITVTDGATGVDGPALTALNDIIYFDLTYDRSPDSDLRMSGLIRKADVTAGFNFQFQGAGSEHMVVSDNSGDIHFQHDNGAVDNIKLDIYNVAGGTKGDKGDKGDPGQGVPAGGTTGQVLGKKSGTDYDTEWGVWSVHSDGSLKGGGSTSSDQLGIADDGVESKHLKAGAVNAAAIGNDQVGPSALTPLQELPTPTAADGGKVVKLKSDRSGWELATGGGGSSFTPTQANLYPSVDTMIETATASSTVDAINIVGDDSAHTITFSMNREIIGEDWGNLTVGFRFRVGHIVPRTGRWYVCKKAHTKGGTGPDNDPTNWSVLTNWAGAWDTDGWYDPGERVLLDGVIYTATSAVTSSDPSPSAADNTKWLADGGGGGSTGGGGVGGYTELLNTEALTTDLTYIDLSSYSFAENEVVEFVASSGNASSGSGRVYLRMPGSPTTKWKQLNGESATLLSALTINSTVAKAVTVVWTGTTAPTDVDRPYMFTQSGTKSASLHMVRAAPGGGSRFVPSQANLFPAVDEIMVDGDDGITYDRDVPAATLKPKLALTEANTYPTVKSMPKAGNNVKITFDDTAHEWVTDVRLPDEAAPRVYALDSRDVRTVNPPYSYSITSEGFTMRPGSRFMEPGPVSFNGYSGSHPGFARDTTNSSNNFNGVEFTLQNAGTTTRTLHVSTEITLANERQYSSAETLTMRVFVAGYFKTKPAADGQVIFTKTFSFSGGYQDAFHFDFDLTLSQAGRAGEHDWWRTDYEWTTGSGEVVAGVIQACKHTVSLPALGSIPKQSFGHVGAHDLDELRDWIPPELKSQITTSSRLATFSITNPDNTGTNAPNESDKADVLLPTVDTTTPFLRAAQDLSRLKLHFAGNAQNGAKDVYLCSRIQGFPPTVLGNTSAASAWTIDNTQQGVMALQDFYLIDVSGNGMGSPTATWDANPGGPKINNVIDGIFHTAHLVAGINFTPVVTDEISIDDDQLTEAAEAGLLHVIRLFSGKTVAEMPLRGIPRPVPFGSGSTARGQIGPGWVKANAQGTGGNSTIIWVNPYRDIHGLHFVLQGTSGANQDCYISGAEIEYAKYDV